MDLEEINAQLERINRELEESNARMVTAIVVLTDIIDDILPHIVIDETTLIKLREANLAARRAILS